MKYNLALLIVCVLLWGCEQPPPQTPQTPPTSKAWSVKTQAATLAKTENLGQFHAQVSYLPGAHSQPDAPVDGARLLKWHARIGQQIEKGQTLAELSSREWSDMNAQRQPLNAQLSAQRKLIALLESQQHSGIVSQYDVEKARANLEMMVARKKALNSQIAQRNNGTLRQRAGKVLWLSPMTGIVESLDCSVGQQIETQRQCITIVDSKAMELVAWMSPRQVSLIKDAKKGQFLGENGRKFTVNRRHTSSLIDPQKHLIKTHWTIESSTDTPPLGGLTGRLEIQDEAIEQHFLVKRLAVTSLHSKTVLFVQDKETWRPVEVRVVRELGDTTLVQSTVLQPSDLVAVNRVYSLKSRLLMNETAGGQ